MITTTAVKISTYAVEKEQLEKGTHGPSIPVKRSNQLSYQANWELVICEFG